MADKAVVHFKKLYVHKSEDYERGLLGLDGEPGRSAEWRLEFVIAAPGIDDQMQPWNRNGVRDNSEHDLNYKFEVPLQGNGLSVNVYGYEIDDSSADDRMPWLQRWHSIEPGWKTGQSYQVKSQSEFSTGGNTDMSYTIEYSITQVPTTQITPGHGQLSGTGFSCLWNAGTAGQVWWPNITEQQVHAKTGELWAQGGRLQQLQPFVVGTQVRYNALWDFSGRGQVWNTNCDEAHFRTTTGELWSWARPAQVAAFVLGGQVRYVCLWNAGTAGQVWWPNITEQQVRDKTGELWAQGGRLQQLQPFVVGNQVRYNALWDFSGRGQVWNTYCDQAHVMKTTAELQSWARPAQLQPFVHNGQLRYSCLWNAGTQRQVMKTSCDEEEFRATTGKLWSWARPAQIFGYAF